MLTHDWADEPEDEPTDDYAQALAEDGYSLARQQRIVNGGGAR